MHDNQHAIEASLSIVFHSINPLSSLSSAKILAFGFLFGQKLNSILYVLLVLFLSELEFHFILLLHELAR